MFYDDFSRGLSLRGSLPRGQARWEVVSGKWSVDVSPEGPHLVGHPIDGEVGVESALVTVSNAWANCEIAARVRFVSPSRRPPEGGAILYFGYRNAGNHQAAHLCLPKQCLELWRCDQGAWRQIGAGSSFNWTLGRWYDVRVRVGGASIACFVDGQLVLDTSHHSLSGGRIGLGTKLCEAAFGRVSVTPLVDA